MSVVFDLCEPSLSEIISSKLCISEKVGMSIMKTVPLFSSDTIDILPLIRSTSLFDIQSPSPVPPYFVWMLLSAWENGLNNFFIPSSLIPMPLSITSIIRCPSTRVFFVILLMPYLTSWFIWMVSLKNLDLGILGYGAMFTMLIREPDESVYTLVFAISSLSIKERRECFLLS